MQAIKCKCGNDKFEVYLEVVHMSLIYKLVLKCKKCGEEYGVEVENQEYKEAVKAIVVNELLNKNEIREVINNEVYAPFKVEPIQRELVENLFNDKKEYKNG